MGKTLMEVLKMMKAPPLREELALNLAVGAAVIRNRFEKIVEPFGLTASQYNVLRILKGAFPEGHPRCEIAVRMIDRAPDITRLIDRLEKQGFVRRDKDSDDRRMSITKITERGLKVIEEIQPLIDKEHKLASGSLTDNECKELSNLLEKLYADSN